MNTGMSALFQIIVSFTYIPRVGFLDHIVALLLVSVRKLHSVSSCCYCCCSVAKSCETVHDPVDCSTPGFPVPHNLPELFKFMSIESMTPSNHFILCYSLLLLPSIFPQHQGLFQWGSSSHQLAKVLKLQLQHQTFQWILKVDFI